MTVLNEIRRSRRSGQVVWLVLALFALRAVVPIGYMPASIGDGGPFRLCHGTSSATIALLGAHDAMHGDSPMHGSEAMRSDAREVPAAGHDERWERCELGIGSADAAIASTVPLYLFEQIAVPADSGDTTLPVFPRAIRYRARAPPA